MGNKNSDEDCGHDRNRWRGAGAGGGSAVYGLGFIGSLIYFLGHASSFGMGVLGFLKALVWPVLLAYKALELLKM